MSNFSQRSVPVDRTRLYLRLGIYGLLYLSFVLGAPSFHYAAALMIALIIQHKDVPNALHAPVTSFSLSGGAPKPR